MITNLKIENFKSISNLDFSPKRINLIVGKNNTGKTSVLEAIAVKFNPTRMYQHQHNMPYFINVKSKQAKILLEISDHQQYLEIIKATELDTLLAFKKKMIEILNRIIRIEEDTKGKILTELENRLDEWITPELKMNLNKKSIQINQNEEKYIYHCLTFENYDEIKKLTENIVNFLEKEINLDKKEEFFRSRIEHSLVLELITERKNKPSPKEIVFIKDLLKMPQYSRENPEMVQQLHDVEKIIIKQNLIENLVRF